MANPKKKGFFLKHATVMEKFEHKRFKNEKKIIKEKKNQQKEHKVIFCKCLLTEES